MAILIETLESRQLFSASLSTVTQDASALKSSSQSIHSDLSAWAKQSAAAVKALFAITHAGKGTPTSRPLIRKFSAHEIAGFHKVGKDVRALLSVTVKDTNAVVSDLKRILKHSTPALQAKLTADIAKLKQQTTTLEAKVTTDAQALDTTGESDLAALMLYPSLKNDADSAKSELIAGLHTVMTDLTTFSTGVTQFATDASA